MDTYKVGNTEFDAEELDGHTIFSSVSSQYHITHDRSERPVEVNIALLKTRFRNAETEGFPGLDRFHFTTIMKETIGCAMSFEEIDTLFTKVDIKSDGYLTWYTFLDYFSQEYQEKNKMFTNLAGKPYPHGVQEYESKRRDSIVSVCFMPVIQKGEINYKRGRYVSVTSDGFISVWNMAFKFISSHAVETGNELLTPMLVYDMVFIASLNLVAISTSIRDIVMFEITTKSAFSKSYHIKDLGHSAICMDFCQPTSKKAILMWGDMSGNVFGLDFDMQSSSLFGLAKANQKNEHVKIMFLELQKGTYLGTKLYALMYLHNDWVTSVKYIKENDIFLSCCQDEDTCMYLGDLKEKKTCYYFNMRKGAISFDYCPIQNVIAAGGMDYCIRVWNPYVRSDATIIFRGFSKPVTHVAINGKRSDVIGLDKGNMVRIYNIKEQALLQIISDRFVSSSHLPVSAMFFNPVLQLVVLGTSRLSVLYKTVNDDERIVEHYSHNTPVRVLCYSECYQEVISACEESTINIWNINTGAIVIQISNAHTRSEIGQHIKVELTAMCLDKTGRRLITGGKDGVVKIWNYSNGSALHTLSLPETNSITGLLNVDDKIYVCGWNRKLGMFVEDAGNEEYKVFKSAHKEEILSMVKISHNTIATASYDGDIIVWALDKAAVVCRLNYLNEVEKEMNPNIKYKRPRPHKQKRKKRQSENDSTKPMRKYSVIPEISTKDNSYQTRTIDQESRGKRPKFKRKQLHGYSIEAMLILSKRPHDKYTANLLTTGACGWVRAWFVDKRGGNIIGQFNPIRNSGENTCALATDADNKYLITGDSQGYIAVWDIRSFCISETSIATMEEELPTYNDIDADNFVYLRKSCLTRQLIDERNSKKRLECDGYDQINKDLFRVDPPLLSVYQGHTRGINALLYIDAYKVIVSASTDCSVRLWSIFGGYHGTFGQQTWGRLDQGGKLKSVRISGELKRVASATTLKILNAGRSTHWDRAMLTMKTMGFLENKVRDEVSIEEATKPTQILGKFYQSRTRHRMLPTLPKLFEIYDAVSVWHTIKYCEMDSTSTFKPLLLNGLSAEQRQRLMADERTVVYTKKVKIQTRKTRRLEKIDKVKTHSKMKAAQERVRCSYRNARAAVERIDVDCRLAGGRNRQATEPIVVM